MQSLWQIHLSLLRDSEVSEALPSMAEFTFVCLREVEDLQRDKGAGGRLVRNGLPGMRQGRCITWPPFLCFCYEKVYMACSQAYLPLR